MLSIQIPSSYRKDKKALTKNFNKFRVHPTKGRHAKFDRADTYDFNKLRTIIKTSDVFVIENFKDRKLTTGVIGINKNEFPALTKNNLDGESKIFLLDAENGINDDDVTFKTIDDAVTFVEKTYKLKVFAGRHSTSGKIGRYHLWVMFDKPVTIAEFKEYMNLKTPDQQRILMGKTGSRPTRLNRNPYFDLAIYTAGRITYGMRTHDWLYTDNTINNRSQIMKSIGRLIPKPITNGYTPSEYKKRKVSHCKTLGMSMEAYEANLRNQNFDLNELIYNPDGSSLMIKDAIEGERYSTIPNYRSPSLQYNGDGEFYDFRGGVRYTVKESYVYDEYISDSGIDFESLRAVVIHAPTGSGKTTIFEKPKYLIAVPRRAKTTIETGQPGEDVVLSCRERHQIITHDKLAAHLHQPSFLDLIKEEGVIIVIDEAHKITVAKKFESLWNLDAIFLSGTLRDFFRPDLPHLHFYRREPLPSIIIADAIPDSDRNTLWFSDTVKMFIANGVAERMLVASVNYSNADIVLNKPDGYHKPPSVLIMDTFASSAYAEQVSLEVYGGKWRVVVILSNCPTWSMDDAVQALNRIRGDNIEKVIVRHKKDNRTLEEMTDTKSINFDTNFNFIDKLAITDEMGIRGGGLNEGFSKNVFGSKDYKQADKFGYLRYLTQVKHRLILPDDYTYTMYDGPTMEFPLNQSLSVEVPNEEEEEDKLDFVMNGNWYKADLTVVKEDDVFEWVKLKENGTIDRLIADINSLGGEIAKFSQGFRYLKRGKGRLSIKHIVKAIRHLLGIELLELNGSKRERFSASITHLKVVTESRFKYTEAQPMKVLNWC